MTDEGWRYAEQVQAALDALVLANAALLAERDRLRTALGLLRAVVGGDPQAAAIIDAALAGPGA